MNIFQSYFSLLYHTEKVERVVVTRYMLIKIHSLSDDIDRYMNADMIQLPIQICLLLQIHPICDRYIKFGLLINSSFNSKFKRQDLQDNENINI